MNMSSVLHRRSNSDVAERPSRRMPRPIPPSERPPGPGDGASPPPWPAGAKIAVAVLLIAGVIAALVAAVAMSTNGSDDRRLDDQVAALTQERDAALDDVAAIDAELAVVRQQLEDARATNGDLSEQVGVLEDRIVSLTEQRVQAVAAAETLSATVDDLEATIAGLEADAAGFDDTVAALERRADLLDAAVRTANQRLASVTAERDALADVFPVEVRASLADARLAGDHDVALKQVYCSGSATCGTLPSFDELTIRRTAEGNLRLEIPGVVEGGLFRAEGAMHLVADSSTAFPACAGVARQADVTMTLFPAGYLVGDGGAASVDGIHATITFEAPAIGDCPTALAFYTAQLTPSR